MRVHAKPLGRYPFYLRPFFWNQRRKYGEVLQAALLWARAPKLFIAVAILFGMIDRRSSPIDANLGPSAVRQPLLRASEQGGQHHAKRNGAAAAKDMSPVKAILVRIN